MDEREKQLQTQLQFMDWHHDLIRLVDYVAVEILVILAIQSCCEFLLELNKVPRKTGLFETTINFGEESTTGFSPTCEQIQHIMISMTNDIVGTVNSVSRVLYLRPFAPYVPNVVVDAPRVGTTISTSVDFDQIRKELAAKIISDYMDAAEYVKIFDNVRFTSTIKRGISTSTRNAPTL